MVTEFVAFAPRDGWLPWLAAGWELADDLDGTTHGKWSVLLTKQERTGAEPLNVGPGGAVTAARSVSTPNGKDRTG